MDFVANNPENKYAARNDEMNLAWQFVAQTGVSVFLTGKAGTGKTTFLKKLREIMPKRMVVLAPTGVAAINAGGQTIHSFFQLPFGPFNPHAKTDDKRTSYKMAQSKKNLIKTLDLLVIDEISMVRADLLDQVDDALRKYRDRTRPFGGVQLLLIGDLMQLSPVAKPEEWALLSEYYDTPYFFSSLALKQLKYVTVELKHIYRQQDEHFINLLADIRTGNVNQQVVSDLNSRYAAGFNPDGNGWIRLTTHNAQADSYNAMKLDALPSDRHSFDASVKGDFPEYNFPADPILTLKEGAQVMFIKNDPNHRYYNGKIGQITLIEDETIKVDCDGDIISVSPVSWDNTKYSLDPQTKEIREEVVGSFAQYPLRLAWAITVHKSQGLTFDKAVLDINASFAHGQVYVALSRCRSLEGLVLSSPISITAVRVDPTVNSYIDKALSSIEEDKRCLAAYKNEYMLTMLDELYDFVTIQNDFHWLARVIDEHLSQHLSKLLYELKALDIPFGAKINRVAYNFRNLYHQILAQNGGSMTGTNLPQRIKDSAKYFSETLMDLFKGIIQASAININNKQVVQIYNNAFKALRTSVLAKSRIFDYLSESDFSVATYLNIRAKEMLGDSTTEKKLKTDKKEKQPKEEKKTKVKKGSTAIETLRYFNNGYTPAEIAKERGLTESTIFGHLAALVEAGKVDADRLISPERKKVIHDVASQLDGAFTLTDIKMKLPDDYTFGEIRIALASKADGL